LAQTYYACRGGLVLSLISGVLILVNVAMASMFLFTPELGLLINTFRCPFITDSVTTFTTMQQGLAIVLLTIGYISAVLVILGANGLKYGIRSAGVVIIIFSTLSLASGGGFVLGFILGVIGGSLGVAGS